MLFLFVTLCALVGSSAAEPKLDNSLGNATEPKLDNSLGNGTEPKLDNSRGNATEPKLDNALGEGTKPPKKDLAASKDGGISEWIDQTLEELPKIVKNLNLSEIALIPIDLNMFLVPMVISGFLGGLDTFHRTGPTDVKADPKTSSLLVGFEAGLRNATARVIFRSNFGGKPNTAWVRGALEGVRVKLVLRVGTGPNGLQRAQVETLEVPSVGKLHLKFQGFHFGPVVDKLIGEMMGQFANDVSKPLVKALQGPMKTVINNILKTVVHPIPNLLEKLQKD